MWARSSAELETSVVADALEDGSDIEDAELPELCIDPVELAEAAWVAATGEDTLLLVPLAGMGIATVMGWPSIPVDKPGI